MIFAELHGKLGTDYSLAHERAEDLLTSTVFQLLRYLPTQVGFAPLLARVRPASVDGVGPTQPEWIAPLDFEEVVVTLWPSLGRAGTPDVILTLLQNSKPCHLVLVEAKLYSGKSGFGEEADDDGDLEAAAGHENLQEPRFERDQLAKYWQGLCHCPPWDSELPKSIVYLTGHVVPPREDLMGSLSRASSMRLGWVSWFDVWSIARAACKSAPRLLPAQDLADLLRHRGFASFEGFREFSPRPPTLKFWRGHSARQWFQSRGTKVAPVGWRWRGESAFKERFGR